MAKSRSSKPAALTALEYLAAPEKNPPAAVCVVHGDEAFLKSEVLAALRREVLGATDSEFSLTVLVGKEARLRDVMDELATVTLFGDGRRLVIVEDADSFVTEYRAELEDLVDQPPKGGVLVLEVKS